MKVGQLFREDMVNRIKDGVENNSNIFMISYKNVSGLQMSSLRKDLKQAGAHMYVTRNSIIEHAFKALEQEKLGQKAEGQSAIIWSSADSVELSKILVKFAKDFEEFNVQGGLSAGELLEAADIKRLSDLPSKNVLRAQLLGTIQAPVTQLLGALNAKSRDLLSILKQLSEQKGGK